MSEEKQPYRIEGRPATIYRVVKSAENPYVMIDRRPIDNVKLSWKAKGILTYLMSRPDGWEVSVSDLVNHSTDGSASIRAGLKELKNAGHMKYTKMRQAGRITGWLIEVYEVPDSDFLHVEILHVEKPHVENRTQVLKNLSNTEKPSNKNKADKPPTPPEILLYRSVALKFPNKALWEKVTAIIKRIALKNGGDCSAADLKPYYEAWIGRGYNAQAITWLEWAEAGAVPQFSKAKSQRNSDLEDFKKLKFED